MIGSISVHLLPELVKPGELAGGIAVVADVLRATSVMVQALAAGADCVIPCLEIGDAMAAATSSGWDRERILLAGERQGLPIAGFDLGNSPDDFTPQRCGGRVVVMTTTNGTRAIHACLEAEEIWIGAFTNLTALVRALRTESRPVHIVCAGTDRQVSWEDTLFAGFLIRALRTDVGTGPRLGNDSARLASAAATVLEPDGSIDLETILSQGRGGQRVREIGLNADVAAAARIDQSAVVPHLLRTREGGRIIARGS